MHSLDQYLSCYSRILADANCAWAETSEVNRVPIPDDLDAIETASVDELRSLQLERLQWSIGHAYENVAPYRTKCDAVGISPADLKSRKDLSKFPFTVKDDLRQSNPFGMFAVPQRDVVRVHASSGTTGKPTVVGYTRNEVETRATVVARSIRASGGGPGDIIHIAYGHGLFTGGLGGHYGAEKRGFAQHAKRSFTDP